MPLISLTASPNKPTHVRRAKRTDCPSLAALIGQLARLHGDEPTVVCSQLEGDLFGRSSWASALVAQNDTAVVGYAILTRSYRAQFGQRGLGLHHLFVAAEARGAGLGTGLVRASVHEARRLGCTYLAVGTQPENVEAQRFYGKLGFQRETPGPQFRIRV